MGAVKEILSSDGGQHQLSNSEQISRLDPAVSAVIATYNRANLVVRAIRSVLGQTFQKLEVIVIDDCSQDNTRESVEAVADPRVRYLRHGVNKGLPAGRNTGIAASRGEYVAFLDDDDEWAPEKLVRQLEAIDGREAVLCAALVNGKYVKVYPRREVTIEDLRGGNEFDPSSLMIKTSVIRELGFDESLRQGEDWDAFIRIAQRMPIAYVREPLLLYSDGSHDRMTNEARQLSIPDLEKRMGMLRKHREFFGPYWFRFHVADTYLSYIGSRKGKLKMIGYAIAQCGVWSVFAVLWRKLVSRAGKFRRSSALKGC